MAAADESFDQVSNKEGLYYLKFGIQVHYIKTFIVCLCLYILLNWAPPSQDKVFLVTCALIGHGPFDDDKCRFCKFEKATAEHLLCDCLALP